MTRFLVCPACGHHEPSAGTAGEGDAGDASDASDDGGEGGEDDAGDAHSHRRDGDGDAVPTDDGETPDCPRCGSRRTYRHDDPALPDAETETYVKFDADSAGER